MSGNIIDLCPVGALNSKPYEYRARTWELRKTESVDVLDARGLQHPRRRAGQRGDADPAAAARGRQRGVDLRQEPASPATGCKRRRLDVPMVKKGGKLQPSELARGVRRHHARGWTGVDGGKVAFIVGDLVDCETMVLVRELAERLGTPARRLPPGRRQARRPRAASGYLFNTTIAGIEQADACLLVGTNPRWEAPIINARLRKRWRPGRLQGRPDRRRRTPLTYPVEELGAGTETLAACWRAASSASPRRCSRRRTPMLILGMGAAGPRRWGRRPGPRRGVAERFGMVTRRTGTASTCCTPRRRASAASTSACVPGEGGRDVAGILDGAAESGEIEVVFLIGADEIDTSRLGNAFVVYQGHHGDRGATAADVVLPGAAYTEKNASWVNTEGRLQRGQARRVPARRGEGGLEDPAGTLRGPRTARCRSTRWARSAPAWPSWRRTLAAIDRDRARGLGRVRGRRRARPTGAVRVADRRIST